jgi:hypothetical protein
VKKPDKGDDNLDDVPGDDISDSHESADTPPAENDDEPDKTAANRHPSLYRTPVLTSPHELPRNISPEEMLAENTAAINRLHDSKRIIYVDGREYCGPGAWEARERLVTERQVFKKKIGPARLLSGFDFEIHLNGVSYAFSPSVLHLAEFLAAFNFIGPTPHGPHSKRDRIVWLIWHSRNSGIIRVGKTPNKVRGPLVQCASCEYVHRYLGRPRDQSGVSTCRRCGAKAHRNIDSETIPSSFGRVSKAGLRRRFKLNRRYLDRILAVSPPIPSAEPSQGS